MRICLATNNTHKILEIRKILGENHELLTLKDIGHHTELPETGNTLEMNSKEKAQHLFDIYKIACIADDSGLEVDALGGRPGVDSAHYAGPERNADQNMERLLSELATFDNKKAQFKTVITYINTDGSVNQFVGTVKGEIVSERRGVGGFGYDPIFVPEGATLTFAEMSSEEKNAISHRAMALQKFNEFLTI